jgi:hypothetical protein
MLKISTTCSVPYGIIFVGSHSISCAIIFLFSTLHVTLAEDDKFCKYGSKLTLKVMLGSHTYSNTKNINLEMIAEHPTHAEIFMFFKHSHTKKPISLQAPSNQGS